MHARRMTRTARNDDNLLVRRGGGNDSQQQRANERGNFHFPGRVGLMNGSALAGFSFGLGFVLGSRFARMSWSVTEHSTPLTGTGTLATHRMALRATLRKLSFAQLR